MKRNVSIKKLLTFFFCALFFACLLFLTICGGHFVVSYHRQLLRYNQLTLDLYTRDFISGIDELERFNQYIYSEDNDFRILAAQFVTSPQQVISEYNLRRIAKNTVPPCGLLLFFNVPKDILFYQIGSDLESRIASPERFTLVRNIQSILLSESDAELMRWEVYQYGSDTFLLNAYRYQDMYVCSALELNAFSEQALQDVRSDSLQYIFSQEDTLLTNREYASETGLTAEDLNLTDNRFWTVLSRRYLVQSNELESCGIRLSCVMPIAKVWEFLQFSVFLVAFAAVIFSLLFWAIFSLVRRFLVYPLRQIAQASERLAASAPPESAELPYEPVEFATIRTALDDLVRQKAQLQLEGIRRERETDHALLQYFQLQTRSHFFLNCLKSLYNMAENQEQQKMKVMILSVSNHLRYIFHDNLCLVPLRAELDEVMDYYHILLLDCSYPFLVTQDVAPDLLDTPVPPLVIQTFLENSYKHSGTVQKPLRFSIQVNAIERDGTPHIRLRLSDNGEGFSDEMLATLNGPSDNRFEQYHVGISNLKRRIALIYSSGYELAFYNGTDGGACALICLPAVPHKKEGLRDDDSDG